MTSINSALNDVGIAIFELPPAIKYLLNLPFIGYPSLPVLMPSHYSSYKQA